MSLSRIILKLKYTVVGFGQEERLQLLLEQYMTKGNGSYTCAVCGKISRDKYNAKLHLDSCHFPPDEGYSCEVCYQVVKTLKALNHHKAKCHK